MTTSPRSRMLAEEEGVVAELELLGIRYLSRSSTDQASGLRPPEVLLADLVRQPSARVRSAVIAVFLSHPEYAEAASDAMERLEREEQLTLQSFYVAAVLLQQEHADRLRAFQASAWRWLPEPPPNWEGLPLTDCGTPREKLAALGRGQRQKGRARYNWSGSCEQVVDRLVRQWEVEARWSG